MSTTKTPLSVSLQIPVAWGDMDALGHVNNTIFLRWFESARIAWWDKVKPSEQLVAGSTGPILARTTIDYRRPVKFPDTITVTAATARVGGKSAVLSYRITSSAQQHAVVAEGETVIVLFDYHLNQTCQIDAALRDHMESGGG